MKKVNSLQQNCIPTPSSCVDWTGPNIESLGVCEGDPVNKLLLEIVDKLEEITGNSLEDFDIDTLISICNTNAPNETTLLTILNVLKDNQVCLMDYINSLNEIVNELSKQDDITVDLKCFDDIDGLGNSLSIDRQSLDQLVVDQLCAHKQRLDTVEGKLVALKAQVDAIDPTATVEELSFATCIDAAVKPTSLQVKSIANAVCSLEAQTGIPSDIAKALSKTPTEFNTLEFQSIAGWDLTPNTWAESYGNLLLAFQNLYARVKYMEDNCCAVTCDDVKIAFFAELDEAGTHIILTFNSFSGTAIPKGFTDKGSTGKIVDGKGTTLTFNLKITNDYSFEIPTSGLDLTKGVTISITPKLGNGALVCTQCLEQDLKFSNGCCILTNNGTENVTIVYETSLNIQQG